MKFVERILVIGRDPSLFREGSESILRVQKYARHFTEYHIISFSARGVKARVYDGKLFLWPTNSFIPFFRVFDAIRIARSILRERKISLIDAQDPFEAGLVAWIVARMYAIPFRLQVHTDILSPWYRRASWKERIRYFCGLFLIPRARCLRVVSERIRRSFVHRFNIPKERISVLPIFTDLAPYLNILSKPLVKNGERAQMSFVAVGRFFDKEKNYSMLIDCMRDLSRALPSARLTLVGDGPDRERYERMIYAFGLRDYVILEGWRTDLPAYLSNFDCLVLPSWYEGWGRVVLEAMASGLAVVMTDVGLAGEIVQDGENGKIIPVGNKKALFDSLVAVSRDSDFRKRLQENARKTAARVSTGDLNAYASAYGACIQSCIEKSA